MVLPEVMNEIKKHDNPFCQAVVKMITALSKSALATEVQALMKLLHDEGQKLEVSIDRRDQMHDPRFILMGLLDKMKTKVMAMTRTPTSSCPKCDA